ncbi:MAG: adenylyl-sulfate reductase subunit alpha [Lachnospiraceae bacterium]|nr:adenylyl-sulfate reductase subunit alpha [Lachnospiraceae bacterium]
MGQKQTIKELTAKVLSTDILIIGGGTAGCYAAYILGQRSDYSILIAEKANIRRSGCLAAGVNALNAYITEGHTPQDYVDYAKRDAHGIAREDLLLSMSERLNEVTARLEQLGLVIQKNADGSYASRGWRNIKINGENIKLLLAKAASAQPNVTVLNHVNITDYLLKDGAVRGAYGFDVNEPIFYEIHAKAVLIATGGAAGLYRPNNPGFSRHKMWYPPFNTGAGYAMGILAGAEMTTFEMRFIALRCKDTIAPVGTIAQGISASQVNARGEEYESRYERTTSGRLYGTVMENREGRGPCYLKTAGISREQQTDLYKAYLNMAPAQTLKWLEEGRGPAQRDVEIEGTEPYIVGGHTASGYWVDTDRQTTLPGLFAAGDVAGGCPQKYVTGALSEAEIAAEAMIRYLSGAAFGENTAAAGDIAFTSGDADAADTGENIAATNGVVFARKRFTSYTKKTKKPRDFSRQAAYTVLDGAAAETALPGNLSQDGQNKKHEYETYLSNPGSVIDTEQAEEAMQKIMDQYAGGIRTDYRYNECGLMEADRQIRQLQEQIPKLRAEKMDDLLRIYELRERLVVCRTLIAHLAARKETRWHGFAENTDYPETDPKYEKYVNSRYRDGKIEVIFRDL